MKKSANLKKRLDELRDAPEQPVEITLKLDADLHRTLKQLAAREKLPLETYIVRLLTGQVEISTDEEVG